MISLFGSQYTLLAPWALLALPLLAGGLVLAYLKRGKTAQRIVPSAMFLTALERRYSRPKTFVPPLRLLLELLAVLLFTLALAHLTRTEIASVNVVLIDNSLSMSAVDGLGQSALDHALRDADALIAAQTRIAKVEIYSSSPSLELVASGLPSIVRPELLKIKAQAASDNLDSAFTTLLKDERLDRLSVFSDRQPRFPKQTLQDYRLDYHHINRAATTNTSNIAITEATLLSNRIELNLVNYSNETKTAQLLLEQLNFEQSRGVALKVEEREITLASSARERVVFTALPAKATSFHLSLRSSADTIILDNEAWLHSSKKLESLTFVGPLDPQQLGLKSIPNLEISYFTPEAFDKDATQTTGPIIFHRMMPSILPARNCAIIMPPETDTPITINRTVEIPALTSWQGTHQLLNYLRFSELQINKLRPITAPSWGKQILNTSAGHAIVVGFPNGSPLAVYGFELFPFEGRTNTATSIMALNLLRWLDVTHDTDGSEAAPLAVKQNESVRDLINSDNRPTNSLIGPGIYAFSSDGTEKITAVNFFNEKESDTLTAQPVSIPEANFSELKRGAGESLIPAIASFLLFLIILDELIARLWAKRSMRRA